jgi:hypothetical protein
MVTFKPSKLGCSFHNAVKDSIEAIGKLAYCAFTIFSFKNFSVKNFCEKEWDKGYPINPNWRKIIFLSINQKYRHEVQYALFLKE